MLHTFRHVYVYRCCTLPHRSHSRSRHNKSCRSHTNEIRFVRRCTGLHRSGCSGQVRQLLLVSLLFFLFLLSLLFSSHGGGNRTQHPGHVADCWRTLPHLSLCFHQVIFPLLLFAIETDPCQVARWFRHPCVGFCFPIAG